LYSLLFLLHIDDSSVVEADYDVMLYYCPIILLCIDDLSYLQFHLYIIPCNTDVFCWYLLFRYTCVDILQVIPDGGDTPNHCTDTIPTLQVTFWWWWCDAMTIVDVTTLLFAFHYRIHYRTKPTVLFLTSTIVPSFYCSMLHCSFVLMYLFYHSIYSGLRVQYIVWYLMFGILTYGDVIIPFAVVLLMLWRYIITTIVLIYYTYLPERGDIVVFWCSAITFNSTFLIPYILHYTTLRCLLFISIIRWWPMPCDDGGILCHYCDLLFVLLLLCSILTYR